MTDESRGHALASIVASAVLQVLGRRLDAVYLHGSILLGGFRWDRSDLDLLVLTAEGLTDSDVDRLVASLTGLEYPGNGLEMSVISTAEAREPHFPAPLFELHVATDGGDRTLNVVDGRRRDGDPDLVLHLLVCLEAGQAIVGPAPDTLLSAPPAAVVRQAVVDEVRWSLAHSPPPEYVVLTAARAWCYLATGQVVSKVDAARWAMSQLPAGDDAAAVLEAAVAGQTGCGDGPSGQQALTFARRVLAWLDRGRADSTLPTGQQR